LSAAALELRFGTVLRVCWAPLFRMQVIRKGLRLDRDGILVAIFAFRTGIPHHWQLFLTTGILGGYTTFSTFSLDVAVLYERGQIGLAALYVSVVLSIGGCSRGSRWSAISPELVHHTQAEFVEKRHVAVASRI
jgi:hypothetical protein